MPLRRKRPTARDPEKNTSPRRKRSNEPRQAPEETLSLRAVLDEDEARISEYERELDRLDAATSTRH
ncbi:hypothetical protein MXD81_63555 [Microbacteriaceae bacterium K1510]|nr:hypothetical protein [Microbacteriaceae bacterium K1510]